MFREAEASLRALGDLSYQAIAVLNGNADIASGEEILLDNLTPLTDDTISPPRPEVYDGSPAAQLDQSVLDQIGSYITPSAKTSAPILPNLFVETEVPRGDSLGIELKACYESAMGARAMYILQRFAEADKNLYGNAHTIAATFIRGMLRLYTTHISGIDTTTESPQYHMTLLSEWPIYRSPGDFRQGVGAYRNARDWAKEQRDEAIAAANRKATGATKDISNNPGQIPLSSTWSQHAPMGQTKTDVPKIGSSVVSLLDSQTNRKESIQILEVENSRPSNPTSTQDDKRVLPYISPSIINIKLEYGEVTLRSRTSSAVWS